MATSRCKKFTFSGEPPALPSPGNMSALVTIGNQLQNTNSQSTVDSLKSANLLNYKKPTNVFLKTFDEAFLVAKDCLEKMKSKTHVNYYNNTRVPIELPENVNSTMWEMSVEAAERTLQHIYNGLHHTCYMLCVKGNKLELYKLEPSGLPDHVQEQVDAAIQSDPLFKKMFRGKDIRLMGCILKERREESTISVEYLRWIESLEKNYIFPDGVFILNLTDAVIIPKDFAKGTVLPVLGGSGHVNCEDITMPNYDDVRIKMGYNADLKTPEDIENPQYETDWSKKDSIAVFRGGPTGCGTTSETNMRLKLAEMRSEDLDVGITWKKEGNTKIRGGNARIDPVRGISIVESDVPPVGFMSMKEQSTHKYLIHIDGNVAAYRLLQTMLTGSLILKVDGPYTLWADHLLQHGVHYLTVTEDLSNLNEMLEWAKKHDKSARKIAQRGFEMAKKLLRNNTMDLFFCDLLWAVSKQPAVVENKPLALPNVNLVANNTKTKKSKKNKKNKNGKTKKSKKSKELNE